MNVEILNTQTPFRIIEEAAQMEAGILIDEVKNARLPTIDLHLPLTSERFSRLRDTGLIEHVKGTRLEKIFDEFDDPNKTTFLANDGGKIVAIGRLRIRPELDAAVLYGFNVEKSNRGSQAGLSILEQCVNMISDFGSRAGKKMKVRINRYALTERKKPAISLMARRLNKVYGENTVMIEEDNWEGQPFLKFTTNLETFAALVDRYGATLPEVLY